MSHNKEKQVSTSFEETSTESQTHRISRRKLLTIAGAGAAGLSLAASVTPEIILARSDGVKVGIAAQIVLSNDDVLKQQVITSAGMKVLYQHYGDKMRNLPALHYKYTHSKSELVSISLEHLGQVNRTIWAFLQPFRGINPVVMQYEFIPADSMRHAATMNTNSKLSGRATLYTTSGQIISSAIFRDNYVVATHKPNAIPNTGEVSASCFSDCFNGVWNTLPWWVQLACGSACGGCFGGVLPACSGCLACGGGFALSCLDRCVDPQCYTGKIACL